MITYSKYRPTPFDSHLEIRGEEDSRESWLVVPCVRNRDSGCVDESNFHAALAALGGEGDDVEIRRFGHWANGWFEIIIVRPGTAAATEGAAIEASLENYPLLNEDDLCERENEEANRVWAECYRPESRIEYIRDNRSQFDFSSFADLMGCVRGKYFAGYASELIR